ncbi:MMPL family transporter, partial [Streptomyces daliensis]|nr:MMPL family transporter [Streptomyces daliensis]
FGAWLARRRLLVLAAAVLAVAVAVPFGADVEYRLSQGGTTAPGSASARAESLLEARFGSGPPHLVFLVEAASGGTGMNEVDDQRVQTRGRRLTARLNAEPGVVRAASYWTLGGPRSLRSDDRRTGLVTVRLAGDEDTVRRTAGRLVQRTVGARPGGLRITATGPTAVRTEIEERSEEDLRKAELLAAPVVLVILVLVFRSVIAALLPLLVGAFAVAGTFVVLRLLDGFTQVSVFSVNITTALGLGLAIDYSLFLITRHREELAAGRTVPQAVAAAVRTAGRTVVFSALTVALSLSAMLVFPQYHLRSFAYAGIAVVALAALGSVVVLPALLALLGRRLDALSVRRSADRRTRGRRRRLRGRPGGWGRPRGRHRRPRRSPLRRSAPRRRTARVTPSVPVALEAGGGFWNRLAGGVMRRPALFALASVALLVTLGLPFQHVRFGDSDDRVLPRSSPAHRAAQTLRREFDSGESSPLPVVLPGRAGGVREGQLADYAARLSRLDGVRRVDAATGSYRAGRLVAPPRASSARFRSEDGGTWLSVVSRTEPYSTEGLRLVRAVRGTPAPAGALVGGQAALLADSKDVLGARLPWALAVIGGSTLVLLFLFTGSVLIPVKAVVLNLLSLTATFGAMVYVFQEGHLRWLVGDFTVTGLIDVDTPVLMFCVAFGLSMDYEVFLLSRVREEYVRTGDNTAAVARGLERTGGLITAAAALVAAVLLSFATSGLTPLKLLGTGLALAVVMDATLVRGVLVPAVMRLAGQANWWAPAPLARLHRRFFLAE